MKLKEAYTILELEQGASPEEAKKRYRELTKKFHPDVNKDPGAEDRFKKINEAYARVQKGGDDHQETGNVGWPFHNTGTFHRPQVIQLENVSITVTVSFKESILGCKREVKYSRQIKCNPCDGSGDVRLNNGCKKCGGKGQTVTRQGPTVMISTCGECRGRSDVEECNVCKGHGIIHTDVSVQISIPAGITNGTTLRLQGMGNYAGSFMGFADQHTDAYCHVTVIPELGLSLEGKDVVSHAAINLIDALKGCEYVAKTIHGDKTITIKPQSRNKEEVIIPNCGVNGTGNQRVILDVKYPKDVDKLINLLNEVS